MPNDDTITAVNPSTGETIQLVNGKWTTPMAPAYQSRYPGAEREAASNRPDARPRLRQMITQREPEQRERESSIDALRELGGHTGPLASDPTARQAQLTGEMGDTTREMGSLYSVPLTAAIPGPKGGSLLAKVGKGAAYGAGMGAVTHGMSRAWQGKLPDLEGTGNAAVGGAMIGGVLGPFGNSRLVRRLPYVGRYLGEAESGSNVAGEPPVGGAGRVGSAGDLASWGEEDLWAGYMKNRETPQGAAIAKEIQRRGLAKSLAGTYRPPEATQPSLKSKVSAMKPGEGTSAARGDMPPASPAQQSASQSALVQQMQDAVARGTPEEKAMALQRLSEMGVKPLEKFQP